MKTLFISNSFWNLYNFRKNLIRKYSQNNEIHILSNSDNFKNKLKNRNVKIFKTFIKKNNFSIINDFKYLISLIRHVKKYKIRCIVSFTIKPNLISLIISNIFSIPVILTVSGLGTLFLRYNKIFFFYLFLLKFLINKKIVIFFHNKYDLLIFKKKKILDKTLFYKVVSGSGIDFKRFKYTKKNFKKNTFIFVGRLIKDKGVEELFDVIPDIKNKYPSVTFKIIGEIDNNNPRSVENSKLTTLINSKYIEYKGFMTDLSEEYKRATCLILPSYREGLSKTLMEGLTSGLPVITTNVPGCGELIKKSKAGILVKPKDNNSLKSQIIKYINFSISKKKVMSINAHKYAKKNFNEKLVIKEYLNAIKKIKN